MAKRTKRQVDQVDEPQNEQTPEAPEPLVLPRIDADVLRQACLNCRIDWNAEMYLFGNLNRLSDEYNRIMEERIGISATDTNETT